MLPKEPAGLRSWITGNDAIRILELIEMSLSCRKKDDFRGLFSKLRDVFPFEFAITGLRGPGQEQNGADMDCSVNINFPEEWLNEYMSKDYLRRDSVVLENFRSFAVQTWSLPRKERYRPKEITSLGMDFGIRECCTHGAAPVAGSKYGSIFCFAGPSMHCPPRSRAILETVVPHLHLALSEVHRKTRPKDKFMSLSPREKEVIEWVKQGKSSWEISSIMKISERTVNFHIGNILRKLDVVNRAQAVAVAARFGLIEIG